MINDHHDAVIALRRVHLIGPEPPLPLPVQLEKAPPGSDGLLYPIKLEVDPVTPAGYVKVTGRFVVVDRDARSRINALSLSGAIPVPCTDDDFFEMVRQIVVEIHVHEAHERILIDGVRRFDPHVIKPRIP